MSVGADGTEGFVLGPEEGDAFWWLGTLTINKLDGETSHGGIDIVDHRVPAGYAPPRHVHEAQDEVFFVIEGQFEVQWGERSWEAGPGSLVFLPRGVPHGFTVSSDGPARTLLINSPAGFSDLIRKLGEPALRHELPGPDAAMPDPDRIAEISAAHGITTAEP